MKTHTCSLAGSVAASRPVPGSNAIERGAPPTPNGEPVSSLSVPLVLTLNIEILLVPSSAVASRLPPGLKASSDGSLVAPVENGEPVTCAIPLLVTLNTEIESSVALATAKIG